LFPPFDAMPPLIILPEMSRDISWRSLIQLDERPYRWSKLGGHMQATHRRLAGIACSLVLLCGAAFFGGQLRRTATANDISAYATSIAEVTNCEIPTEFEQSMVILASTAIESTAALSAFTSMVRKLPLAKPLAHPPVLFKGLKVLLLEDAGILKRSFWSSQDENFENPKAINYEKMAARSGFSLDPAMVEAWTNGFQGLDGGWSYDNREDVGLGGIGFDRDDFTYVSIFDLCATQEQAKAIFLLQSQRVLPSVPMVVSPGNPCLEKFKAMLGQASIVFANGGNPDFLGYVLKRFAPELGQAIADRVQSGSILYQGRSAGAMAASRDFAMTYEPSPLLAEILLDGDTAGLSLAGKCSLRPHASQNLWNIPSNVFGYAVGHTVVRVANGDGLYCDHGTCRVVGKTSRAESDAFAESGLHLERVVEAYRFAYNGFHPPRPNFVSSSTPETPNCRLVLSGKKPLVALASSGLEDPDAKEAFRSLVRALPTKDYADGKQNLFAGLKVLILDDAAFLSDSFWNPLNADFANPDALTYVKSGMLTSPEDVSEFTDGYSGLDPGWITDVECAGSCGGVGDFGFDIGAFARVSAFDICATMEQKKALFQLQVRGVLPQVDMTVAGSDCIKQFRAMLEEASILIASSGNPDLLGFVYKIFAPSLGEEIVARVNSGSLTFLGLGAAAMAFGHNFAATASPRPSLQKLLKGSMDGLKLAGQCAVIPGWDEEKRLWDITSSLFEDAINAVDMIGLPDGAVLLCKAQTCEIRGSARSRPERALDGPDTPGAHRGRLVDVMSATFS